MADNSVFISGVAKGAFEDALGNLPPWATESTAFKIQGILDKTLNLQTRVFADLIKTLNNLAVGSGSLSPDEAKRANDELDKFIRGIRRANEEQPKERKRWKDREDQHTKDKKWWQSETLGRAGVIASLTSFGLMMKTTVIESVDTFDKLYRSGINVMNGFDTAKDGFQALQQIAVLTGVRYTELAATLVKYNTAVNAFGLGKFTKTMAGASKDLTQFGYTTRETADLLGSYLESQRGYNNVNSKNQDEVQKDLVKFGERVTRLSQATGILRTKLLEDIEAISQSVEANILAGQVGNDASQSTLEFIASFKDKNLGQAFLRMMTDAIKPLNDTFMDFQKTGFGGFGQELMNFSQSLEGIDPTEAARRTAEFAQAHDQEIKVMVQRSNLLRQAGLKEADGVLKVVTGLQQQARAYKAMTPEEKKRADATVKATSDIRNAFERLQSQMQQAFSATIPLLDFFTKTLTIVNSALEGVADWLKTHTLGGLWTNFTENGMKMLKDTASNFWEGIASVTWEGIKKVGMSIGESIKEGFISVINTPLNELVMTLGLVIAGLGALKSAGIIGDMLFGGGGRKRAGASRGAAGRATSGGGGPGFLEKLGKGIGEIGKGIGTATGGLIKGILVGIAEGLTAMGSKSVLLGAVNLGLTAVALTAMGAAVWVAGKGIQQFLEIKWEDLAKAGVALVGLGLAGAAAGASALPILAGAAAFAAMGAAIWVIGKAIEAIGSGLSSLNTGIQQGANSITVLTASLGGLSNSLSSLTGLDKLKTLVSTINDLNLLKAVAFAKLGFGGSVSLPSPTSTTGVSVPTSPRPSTLNSPSLASTKQPASSEQPQAKEFTKSLGVGIEKPTHESSINTMLGYQNSLLEQLLLSMNNLVSTNRDILKYTRAHT